MKNLPIGTNTFADLRNDNFIYVDKTPWLYTLVAKPKGAYFLSRPRRFGKSLTLSTLEAIFSGKRELFDGLAIAQTDYSWETFPVLHFDISEMDPDSTASLKKSLFKKITQLATDHEVTLDTELSLGQYFAELLAKISKKHNKQLVVLIDEYDKPISENLTNIPLATAMRDTLSDFYTILKSSDRYLRFVLLTGVSKFAKAGVFSKLNHLMDLSMDPRYAALCGYTQEELAASFSDHIALLAHTEQTDTDTVIKKIRDWYNGYRFSIADVRVYNPFSTLLLFEQGIFKNHWFETGTPKLLIDMIKHKQYNLENVDGTEVVEHHFAMYELERLEILPLLVQTGYLTIQGYDPEWMLFKIGFPNFEVKNSFLQYLLNAYTEENTFADNYLKLLIQSLQRQDLNSFFEALKRVFAKIPYDIQLGYERYYQSIFYIIFTLLKLKISAEVRTNTGRIDAMVETPNALFFFEFKVDDTAKNALSQITQKGYAFPFGDSPKPIHKVGVSFSTKERNVVDWEEEIATP